MLRSGYVRLNPHPSDDAVSWWFTMEDPFGTSMVFARGGRVSTVREARKILREQWTLANAEFVALQKRASFWLKDDGSIETIDYGPYDLMVDYAG